MYNQPFYNQQANLDRINAQMNELEKIRQQLQQPVQQPTNLTQNFQISPTNRDVMRYANNIEEVQRDMVLGDTPYFSKDMSILWIKNIKGEIKSYELTEIIEKDDKDIKIEFLQAQIEELKKGMKKDESINASVDEPIKDEKSTSISTIRANKKK